MRLTQTDREMRCLACDAQLTTASLLKHRLNEAGLETREFIGHCDRCGRDFEVVQERPRGQALWRPTRFRMAAADEPFGPWYRVEGPGFAPGAPPAPTPVLRLGPGGDYARSVSDEDLAGFLQSLTGWLDWAQTKVDQIKRYIASKQGSINDGQQNG